MQNIYYNPEKCGLEIVDVLDDPQDYAFNTLLIVRATDTNRVYYAASAGCSCPVPFEEYHYASADDNDLNEVTYETLDSFINVVNNFPVSIDERKDAIRKVEALLK